MGSGIAVPVILKSNTKPEKLTIVYTRSSGGHYREDCVPKDIAHIADLTVLVLFGVLLNTEAIDPDISLSELLCKRCSFADSSWKVMHGYLVMKLLQSVRRQLDIAQAAPTIRQSCICSLIVFTRCV